MDYKKILLSLAAKTLNMSEDKVQELIENPDDNSIKEDALKNLLNADKERIKVLRTEYNDEGFKRAEKKLKSDFEQEIKEKFNIESDKKGIELIESIVTAKATPEGLTEEAVKKHPVYLNLERKVEAVKVETEQHWKSILQEKETQFNRKEKLETVKKKALLDFESLNPILPSDPKKAENQKRILLNELNDFDFEILDDNEILVLNKETNKRVEDEHGNPVKFHEIVRQKASAYFDFKQADERSSTGNDPNKPKQSITPIVIKSEEDKMRVLMDKTLTLEQKEEALNAYNNK